MSTSGGTGRGLSVATAHLATAAIRTLFSASTVIVAAPGASKMVSVVGATFEYVPITNGFVDTDVAGLFWGTVPVIGSTASGPGIAQLWARQPNVHNVAVVGPVPTAPVEPALAAVVNQPLVVGEASSNPVAVAPIVTSALVSGGTGYAVGDTGTIGPDGISGDTTATYVVTSVAPVTGAVTGYTVTAAGAAYQSVTNPELTAVGGAQPGVGSGFTINILTVDPATGDLYVTVTYQIVTLH